MGARYQACARITTVGGRENRDAALRDARRFHSGPPSAAAKRLAAELDRYLAGPWLLERGFDDLPEATAKRRMLHKVIRLNGGRPLGWRQILWVFESRRGPRK